VTQPLSVRSYVTRHPVAPSLPFCISFNARSPTKITIYFAGLLSSPYIYSPSHQVIIKSPSFTLYRFRLSYSPSSLKTHRPNYGGYKQENPALGEVSIILIPLQYTNISLNLMSNVHCSIRQR